MFPVMSDKEYRSSDRPRCPVCRDVRVEWVEESPEVIDIATIHANMRCWICNATWTEVYSLAGYDNLSKGGDNG